MKSREMLVSECMLLSEQILVLQDYNLVDAPVTLLGCANAYCTTVVFSWNVTSSFGVFIFLSKRLYELYALTNLWCTTTENHILGLQFL